MKTVEYILPEFCLSPLVNGDYSGLSEEDTSAIVDFLADELRNHPKLWPLGPGEDCGFMRYHDLQPYGVLACDCVKFSFHVD